MQLALKSDKSKIKTESTHLFKVLRDGKQAFWPRAVWAVSEASLGNLVLQPDQESTRVTLAKGVIKSKSNILGE